MLDSGDISDKISKYEIFVEEKLKTDLKKVENILQIKNSMYKDWDEVENMSKIVQQFEEKDADMHLKFEIGKGVSTFAEVSDYDAVYVNIGLGYLLKMEPEEAIKYAKIRKKALKREVEHNRKLAVEIKVHIKLVLLALNELNDNARN